MQRTLNKLIKSGEIIKHGGGPVYILYLERGETIT